MKDLFKYMLVSLFLTTCFAGFSQDYEPLSPDENVLDASRKAGKFFELGMEAYKNNDFEGAIEHFTKSLEKSPSYFPAQTNRGLTYLVLKNDEKALEDLSYVTENHPESHAALFGMGVIYMREGDYQNARDYLSKAVEIEYDVADYHYALGKADDMIAQYEFALNDFDEAIKINPLPKYYIERGNTYAKIDEYEKAKADYLKALEIESGILAAENNMMVVNSVSGGDESALEEINQKIDKNPTNASFIMARGIYYLNNAENDKALSDFEKAVELDGENIYTHINKSAVLIKLGKYKEAEEVASYVIEENPDLRQGYFNRGIAREMLRDKSGACEDWEQAFLLGVDKAEEFLNSPICNE